MTRTQIRQPTQMFTPYLVVRVIPAVYMIVPMPARTNMTIL